MKILFTLAGLVLLPILSLAQPATVPRPGGGSSSGSGTNYVRPLSPAAGSDYPTEFATNISARIGDIGIAWPGNKNPYIGINVGTAGNTNWGHPLNFYGGLGESGSRWSMPDEANSQRSIFWFNGSPNLAALSNATAGAGWKDTAVEIANMNPSQSGSTLYLQFTSTNALTGYSLVGTNSDGHPVYITQFGMALVAVGDSFPVGRYNQAGSMQIIGTTEQPFMFTWNNARNFTEPITGSKPYFIVDPQSQSNLNSPFIIAYPQIQSNIFDYRAGDAMRFNLYMDALGTNVWMTNGIVYVTRLESGGTGSGAVVLGGHYEARANFNLNGSGRFNSPSGIGAYTNAWTFDASENGRMGFAIISGDFPYLAHTTNDPLKIGVANVADLHTRPMTIKPQTIYGNSAITNTDPVYFLQPITVSAQTGATNVPFAVLGTNGLSTVWVRTNTAPGASVFAIGTNLQTATLISNWNGVTAICASNSVPIVYLNGGNGNVGIGTATPISPLTVASSGGINVTNNDAVIDINTTAGGSHSAGINFKVAGTNSWAFGLSSYNSQSLSDFTFWEDPASTPRLTLKDGGLVGIGTTTPSGKLEVAGTQDSYLFRVNTNVLVVTNGLVGIGTNAPQFPLHVYGSNSIFRGSADTMISVGRLNGKASLLGAGTSGGVFQYDDSGIFAIESQSRANIDAGILSGSSTKLYLTASGLVGIGTTTPTERLSVQGNVTVATNLIITNVIEALGNIQNGTALSSSTYAIGVAGSGSFRIGAADTLGFTLGNSVNSTPDTMLGRFGVNSNYFGTASTGNGSIVLSNAAYNGFTYYRSNGVTAAQVEAGLNNGDFAKGVLSNVFNIVWKSNNVVFWKISAP